MQNAQEHRTLFQEQTHVKGQPVLKLPVLGPHDVSVHVERKKKHKSHGLSFLKVRHRFQPYPRSQCRTGFAVVLFQPTKLLPRHFTKNTFVFCDSVFYRLRPNDEVGELVDYAAVSEIRLHPHKADRLKIYFGVPGLKAWTVSCPNIGTAFIQPFLDKAEAAKSPILLTRQLPDGKWIAINAFDDDHCVRKSLEVKPSAPSEVKPSAPSEVKHIAPSEVKQGALSPRSAEAIPRGGRKLSLEATKACSPSPRMPFGKVWGFGPHGCSQPLPICAQPRLPYVIPRDTRHIQSTLYACLPGNTTCGLCPYAGDPAEPR
jgi:hypothetical protein